MRLIYETPPAAARFPIARSSNLLEGFVSFRVYMFEHDEELPALPTVEAPRSQCRRRADLRAAAGPGQPIVARMPPRSPLRDDLPETITIPDSILESLPPEALLRFAWCFGQEGGGPGR